ncbi:MAG: hypothetical protein ABI890_01045, partial [Lapillicoccus sp.]
MTPALRRRAGAAACGVVLALALAACSGSSSAGSGGGAASGARPSSTTGSAGVAGSLPAGGTSPHLPAALAPYAATVGGVLTGPAASARHLVYVPNQVSGTVQVIDPVSYQVVDRFRVARSPEHVVPSHDLRTLWVNSDGGNTLTPIDPATGTPGSPVSVPDPYNLYFSPDGAHALVMAERLREIEVRDPQTMAAQRVIPVGCYGVNHADFTADLRTMVASCEFSGELVVLDPGLTQVVKTVDLNAIPTPGATDPAMARSMGGPAGYLRPGASSMPQDVRLSPDGRSFLVADMLRNGIWVVDATTLTVTRFVHTGKGAHGIYFSRDTRSAYVSNRDEGTISVLDAQTLAQTALWRIPGGGSPDMGGVIADGHELWLSGRYNSVVYVFDTT